MGVLAEAVVCWAVKWRRRVSDREKSGERGGGGGERGEGAGVLKGAGRRELSYGIRLMVCLFSPLLLRFLHLSVTLLCHLICTAYNIHYITPVLLHVIVMSC